MALPSQRLAAIMIALRRSGSVRRLGGLRRVTTQLKELGHSPSRFRTLFHTTPAENVPSILRQGLLVRRAGNPKGITRVSGAMDRRAIYGGSREMVLTQKLGHETTNRQFLNAVKTSRGRAKIVSTLEKNKKLAHKQYTELKQVGGDVFKIGRPGGAINPRIFQKKFLKKINLNFLSKSAKRFAKMDVVKFKAPKSLLTDRHGLTFNESLASQDIPAHMLRRFKPVRRVKSTASIASIGP